MEPEEPNDTINHWLTCGATVYIAGFLNEPPPRDLQLLRGVVLLFNDTEVRVAIDYNGHTSEVDTPRSNVYQDEHTARKRLLAKRLFDEREWLTERLPKIAETYPAPIRHTDEVRMSGNPLRAGEPRIASFIQFNAWGSENNAQKCLMIAGSIWQDIGCLFSILTILSLASEHTKKLVGKYIVIEMQSLRDVLGRLSKLEPTYMPLFRKLGSELGRLDQEFGFPTLRKKIGAHRDGDLDILRLNEFWKRLTRYNLIRHLDLFAAHFQEMHSLFRLEMIQYFREPDPMPNIAMSSFPSETNESWEPFDPPRFRNDSKF